MIKYILVLLAQNSTSFCHYSSNLDTNICQDELISLESLKRIISAIKSNHWSANFLYGNTNLPREYEKLINQTGHTKIQPASLKTPDKNAIVVINPTELDLIHRFATGPERNFVVRLPKQQLNNLSEYLYPLLPFSKRINVILLDVDRYTEDDYKLYVHQLVQLADHLSILYKSRKPVELNLITDRMLLLDMKNCNAGLEHVTLAPNGKFYLCPGFYYNNSEDSIGDPINGVTIKNEHLLKIENAPICRNCDAFQCKRCIYLNKKSTLELNTPSRQQCIVSHMERNTSQQLLETLSTRIKEFKQYPPIPPINYLDPFEMIKFGNSLEGEKAPDVTIPIMNEKKEMANLAEMTDRELLESIYKMQHEILNNLKINR